MLRFRVHDGAAWLVAACLAGSSASAAEPKAPKPPPKSILLEAARPAPGGGRSLRVMVPQAELGSNINPSYASLAMGGGVLGVLIDAKVTNDHEKRAAANITPVRDALLDFDADQLALDATRAGTAALPWLAAGEPAFGRDPTAATLSATLAASPGQSAYFTYIYDTSADFSSIRVDVTIAIADKTAGKAGDPDSALILKNLVYRQTVTSVVALNQSGTLQENAARWAAHDGALAKKALGAGFSEVGRLIPRAMTLTPDDLERMNAAEKKSVSGYAGKVQEEGPAGTLLFNGGLIHVQTIAE